MPEEPIIDEGQNTVTYNVVLDPGDIARQAEEIRNQLDLALGVGSNAGVQFVNTADVINPQFAPLPTPDFTGMQGQFGTVTDQSFWQKAQQGASNIYESMTIGMDRLRQDLSVALNRTSGVIQDFQPTPQMMAPPNREAELLPDTFGEYLMSAIGFGGDITGPIPPSAYQKYGQQKLVESIGDVFKNPGQAYNQFTSTPVGMAANIAGYIFAPEVMLAVDLAMMGQELLTGTYNKREDLAGGIQEIARQQFGNIGIGDARKIADQVVDFTFSDQGIGREYTLEEVSGNILQFANEGGFANVRNSTQLQEKIQSITEDLRQFGRDMGVFQDEAISILADMERRGIAKVEEMRDISTNMRFYSGVTGMAPTELLQGAMQTAEMFRGTMTPGAAMDMFVDAEVEASRLVRSQDPETQSLVYRLGGQQGVTQTLLNTYNQAFSGPMGELTRMSLYSGGQSGNVYDMINTTAGNFTSGADWFDYQGGGNRLATENTSLDEIAVLMGERAMSVWQGTGQEGNPTIQQLRGILVSVFGLNPKETEAVMSVLQQRMTDLDAGNQFQNITKAGQLLTGLQGMQENRETTVWGDIQTMPLLPGGVSMADVQRGFTDVGYTVGGTLDWLWSGAKFNLGGGWGYDFERGEMEYGFFTQGGVISSLFGGGDPSLLGTTITPENMPTDEGVMQQLALGPNSEYMKGFKRALEEDLQQNWGSRYTETELMRMPKEQRDAALQREQDEKDAIVAIGMGDLESAMDNDMIFAYTMLRTGPDVTQRAKEKMHYADAIENIIDEEGTDIFTNEDGSLKTSQELVELFKNRVGNPFNLNDETLNRVVYQGLRKQDTGLVQKIITDEKELSAFEKRDEQKLQKAFDFGDKYREDLKADLPKRIRDTQKSFQEALYEMNQEGKYKGTLPESFGWLNVYKASEETFKDLENRKEEIKRDEFDREYIAGLEQRLVGSRGFTEQERDVMEEWLYSEDSPLSKRFKYYLEDRGLEKDVNARQFIDKVTKDFASQFKEKGIDLTESGTIMAFKTMVDRRMATGQAIEVTDFDIEDYNTPEFKKMQELYTTVTSGNADNDLLKQRIDALRQNTTLTPDEFRQKIKEDFKGYDVWDYDKDKSGVYLREMNEASKLHTTYLYTIAKDYDSNVVSPKK